jgi:hypothetical protein
MTYRFSSTNNYDVGLINVRLGKEIDVPYFYYKNAAKKRKKLFVCGVWSDKF